MHHLHSSVFFERVPSNVRQYTTSGLSPIEDPLVCGGYVYAVTCQSLYALLYADSLHSLPTNAPKESQNPSNDLALTSLLHLHLSTYVQYTEFDLVAEGYLPFLLHTPASAFTYPTWSLRSPPHVAYV